MKCFQAGRVAIANAPGTGVADDKLIYTFIPDIVRYYLGEEAIIPNVETYRCGIPNEREHVLANLQSLVVKSVSEAGGYGMLIGPTSSAVERESFRAQIEANPRNFIAQPTLHLSTVPSLSEGELYPCHVDLRPYVLRGSTTWVTPGGHARCSQAQFAGGEFLPGRRQQRHLGGSMLCRVADSLYWIARYIERAENLVRFLKVGWAVSLDTEHPSASQWLSLVDTCADRELFEQLDASPTPTSVIHFITREVENPNSISNCIASARENARQIREVIPSEVFEEINELHLLLQEEPEFWQLTLTEQLDEIRKRCLVVRGVEEATMQRDESWCFTRIGRMLERADKTARMLDVKYFLLLPRPEDVGGPLDELQWIALLRSVGAYQMYRQYHAEISPYICHC